MYSNIKFCKFSIVMYQIDWMKLDLSVFNCLIIQKKPTQEHDKMSPGELTERVLECLIFVFGRGPSTPAGGGPPDPPASYF